MCKGRLEFHKLRGIEQLVLLSVFAKDVPEAVAVFQRAGVAKNGEHTACSAVVLHSGFRQHCGHHSLAVEGKALPDECVAPPRLGRAFLEKTQSPRNQVGSGKTDAHGLLQTQPHLGQTAQAFRRTPCEGSTGHKQPCVGVACALSRSGFALQYHDLMAILKQFVGGCHSNHSCSQHQHFHRFFTSSPTAHLPLRSQCLVARRSRSRSPSF